MGAADVRPATNHDKDRVLAVITLAFATDPIARWANPTPENYLSLMPSFADAFGGNGFPHSTVYMTGDGDAAAMWLPPGVEPDQERMSELLTSHAPPELLENLGGLMEALGEWHPDQPHWYLPVIGVDPAAQSKGLGSALMGYALERCDADRLPAYLESSNPRNIGFYERCGFEVLTTLQIGSSPPVTPMLRRPH